MRSKRFILLPFLMFLFCLPVLQHASGKASAQYYELSPQEIVDYVNKSKGRKVIFIYASWCPHCRKAFPQLMAIEEKKSGSIFAVSVDKKKKDIINYLKKYGKLPLRPIILKGSDKHGVEKAFGVSPRSGVPHFILLDEDNNVVRNQNMYPADIEKYILDGSL